MYNNKVLAYNKSHSRQRQRTPEQEQLHVLTKWLFYCWTFMKRLQWFGIVFTLLLLLSLSSHPVSALALGIDPTHANLTELGSPAFVHSQQQFIPNGSQQYYEVTNTVRMTDIGGRGKEEASYTFKTELKINSVWHSDNAQLLEIFFIDPTVSAPTKSKQQHMQYITKIPDRPFYISLVDNKPDKVIAHSSRDQSLLNLERGIASLLQLQYADGPITEMDISGQCNVFYNVQSSTKIVKTKTNCWHWDLRVNYRSEVPLGVQQHSKEEVVFHLSADGALLKAESFEEHSIVLAAKPDAGNVVTSQFTLKHLEIGNEQVEQFPYGTLDEAIGSLLEWYRQFDIEADVDGKLSEIKDTTLKAEIADYKDLLANEHVGKETLALATAKLLPLARITKEEEFVDILTTHKKLANQLVDLLAAVQTIDAHNAIHKVYSYDKKNDLNLLEKYMQALAAGTHPERAIIEHLHGLLLANNPKTIKNEKLRDTVIQTVAALTRQSGFEANDPLLQEVRKFIIENLTNCESDILCHTLYIRALENLQDLLTLPALMKFTLHDDVDVNVAALQALKAFPLTHFTELHRRQFADIFYQRKRKYDTTARVFAMDILLALKPTKEELGRFLDYLGTNDRQFEIKTYVLQKLRMMAEKCERLNALFQDCLAQRPMIKNYNVLAQKGLTTVLTRDLSKSPAFNESLLSVQEINQGVLKRGSVELILGAGSKETSTFKLALYTTGLAAFVGDGDDDMDGEDVDNHPASAGMEISIQGVVLRPLIFFVGQSELMGHVWSGTASEPTPAYQATTLAQDHEHYLILASGATVYTNIIGTKSVDLNGKVKLSLWNRNANTEIQQNSGAAVVGYMTAGFTYAKLKNEFTVTSEPKISLKADLDFYSGIKLCMQLERPELLLTHSNTKTVVLNAASKPYVKHIHSKIQHKSPGLTLALNQKNNEMCNMIFS